MTYTSHLFNEGSVPNDLAQKLKEMDAAILSVSKGQPSFMPGLMPAGAIAENVPRSLCGGGDAATPVSGTPLIFPGPYLQAGVAVSQFNLFQSGTAPVGQTHAWAALLDITGKILAISADAGGTAWSAGTFVPISVAVAYTPAADVQTLATILFAGTTWPTLRGYSCNGALIDAWTPHIIGASTTTGLTTPPAVGTSLGLPSSSGSNNYPYLYVS